MIVIRNISGNNNLGKMKIDGKESVLVLSDLLKEK